MDVMASDLEPENPSSPPLSRPGNPESGNQPSHATSHRPRIADWDISSDSTSASSSSAELETDRNSGDCDKMMEKWRLIRLADRQRSQTKIYPTHERYAATFGENYSKFYKAFQQGISAPEARRPIAATIPAKRSAAASELTSKRRKRDDRASFAHSSQHQARKIPDLQPAVTTRRASVGAVPDEPALPSDVARDASVTPRPMSYSEVKEKRSRRKGVGIYAGNWEYATDEERVPEYMSVVQVTAGSEGRTTRRAYAKMTSKHEAKDSGHLVGLSPGNEVRKSGRARNAVDYTGLLGSQDNAGEVAAPEQTEEGERPPIPKTTQRPPSTPASSTPTRPALMPDHPSRPVPTPTAMNTEQHERPNLSWNAIVYEILANSETPLTFPQLVQRIRDRYPFFKSSSQDKILESGTKNPLYFHEAFCKGEIVNGKQTWGLKPGEFVDKKTGEVLTPRPRHTISSPGTAEQVHEKQAQSPGPLTSKLSQIHNHRSSNPRFGREILNSPEIPDSQDAKAATSSPQGEESLEQGEAGWAMSSQEVNALRGSLPAEDLFSPFFSRKGDGPTATEHAPHLESFHQDVPPFVRNRAHELADAADGTSAFAFVGTGVSDEAPQPNFQGANTTRSTIKTTSISESPMAARVNLQNDQNFIGAIDHEASATAEHSSSAVQAPQSRTSPIPLSTGESEHGSGPTIIQAAPTPVPTVHAVSATGVPNLLGDCAAESQTPSIALAAPKPSVAPVTCTQLDDFLPNGKAEGKENANLHLQEKE